jgi:hypothetical protein
VNVKKLLATAVIPFAVVGALAAPASADHNSNNRATFTGDASGTAIANYSEGRGTFNAGTRVRGLEAGTYTYTVSLNGGNVQTICTFTVRRSGNGGCSAQNLMLGGFTTAEIRAGVEGDAEFGEPVATDRFTRQGKSECRDPNQAGTESQECPNRTV